MRKKNSENMRKKEYISVIFKTSYLTRPNDTPYIGDITNIIITHYMPLTYYILPLSTTIILYTCHNLPPTPLSYYIHATILLFKLTQISSTLFPYIQFNFYGVCFHQIINIVHVFINKKNQSVIETFNSYLITITLLISFIIFLVIIKMCIDDYMIL